MKKIVIACDSFKGSVSSVEASDNIGFAIEKIFPDCQVIKLPVADGGEGTVVALVGALKGKIVRCTVNNPLMRPVLAEYGILGEGNTAVIEMASASGLTLLPETKRNPLLTTTYGTGEMIKDALMRGCRNFLIGIGGSATNDAGTGMLKALGFRFYDKQGAELGIGGQILEKIHTIDRSAAQPELNEASFTVACDVANPFFGKKGAAHVFARQKGADEKMIQILDKGLKHFAAILKEKEGKDIGAVPGAGAAGGLGGGFLAFLSATLKPGIQMVLDAIDFNSRIEGADLIITGEGKLDQQTGMGKTAAGILEAGKRKNIPVMALAGCVEDAEKLNEMGFLGVIPIVPGPVSLEKAMQREFACANIRRTMEQQLRIIRYYQSLK